MPKTVAVMQPYFFPYAGYFSLMRAVDHFVLFDCVQFPRRGWVHRNRVPGPSSAAEWLTLPLLHQPREITIRDLAFTEDAGLRLAERLRRYPWLLAPGESSARIRAALSADLIRPVDFLVTTLRLSADLLGLGPEISFSSSLHLPPYLRAQDRIIAAVEAVGGDRYVNLSGGRMLYQAEAFTARGIDLLFLDPYNGTHQSMLYRFCAEPADAIAKEIASNAQPRPA